MARRRRPRPSNGPLPRCSRPDGNALQLAGQRPGGPGSGASSYVLANAFASPSPAEDVRA